MSGRWRACRTAAELELYVVGALDASLVEGFESHCATCDRCAGALAGEAQLEVAFEQIASRPVRVAAARPVRAAVYGVAGVLAMAAAAVLWMGRAPATAATAAGEGSAVHHAMDDGAILDARNDALDGG
jgi:hypothetical protein